MAAAKNTMSGKGSCKAKIATNRGGRNRPKCAVFERARADAVGRLHHDGRHRGFDAVKDARHPGSYIAIGDVHPRQAHQHEQRGQHKQATRHHAAPGAVHEPADVGGQLLRLRAGCSTMQ